MTPLAFNDPTSPRPFPRASAWARLTALLLCLVGTGAVQAEEPPIKDPVVVDAPTDAIIQGALKYLASKQLPNGSWGSSQEEQAYPIAMTGYVLMTFQAAGQLPGEGEFGKTVSAGMQFLLDATAADGAMGNRANGNYM